MKRLNIIVLIALVLLIVSCTGSDNTSKYTVEKGDFKASITETGDLQAINAVSINMPPIGFQYGWRFKIIDLVKNGSVAHKGDTIAKIDPSNIQKVIIEKETRIEIEEGNLNKMIIQQENAFKSLQTKLEEVEANYDLKKLELEKFKFESPQKHKVKQLEFNQVQISKDKELLNIEQQRIIHENQIKIQKIKVEQIKISLANAYKALEMMNIKSPIDGIVQIKQNRRTQQNYKIGDELFMGQSFALVPDIQTMKVKTKINELDYPKIKVGQEVVVRLDALPEVAFHGQITYLGKLSKPKERKQSIKVFDAEIVINEKDERLKPGMTVSCQIYYADMENVTYIGNECLLLENGKHYIYLKNRKRQQVHIGPSNNNNTVILDNLKKGLKLIPIKAISQDQSKEKAIKESV